MRIVDCFIVFHIEMSRKLDLDPRKLAPEDLQYECKQRDISDDMTAERQAILLELHWRNEEEFTIRPMRPISGTTFTTEIPDIRRRIKRAEELLNDYYFFVDPLMLWTRVYQATWSLYRHELECVMIGLDLFLEFEKRLQFIVAALRTKINPTNIAYSNLCRWMEQAHKRREILIYQECMRLRVLQEQGLDLLAQATCTLERVNTEGRDVSQLCIQSDVVEISLEEVAIRQID